MSFIKLLSINCSTIASPRPDISIASRDAKCTKERNICAGHSLFVHLRATSSFIFSNSSPHTGHTLGISYSTSFPVLLLLTTLITSGITSPAF